MSNLDALIQATVRDYRDSVVTILTKEREAPKLSAVGSGFIIRSAQNKCLVMACCAQPKETDGIVHHSCTGTEGCYGGPLIFNSGVIGVHIGRSGRNGLSASTETVNAALKAWLQIPPDVTKPLGR